MEVPGIWPAFVMPLLEPVVACATQLVSGFAQQGGDSTNGLGAADLVGGLVALGTAVIMCSAASHGLRPSVLLHSVEGRRFASAWYHSGCRVRTALRRVWHAETVAEGAKAAMAYLGAPLGAWRAQQRSASGRSGVLARNLRPLYGDCMPGRHWWLLVDGWSAVALGVLEGVLPSSKAGCEAVLWIAVVVLCGVAVAAAAMWPVFTKRVDGAVYMVCAVGGAVIGVLAAFGASDGVLVVMTIALLPVSLVGVVVSVAAWVWRVGSESVGLMRDMRLTLDGKGRDQSIAGVLQTKRTQQERLQYILRLVCAKQRKGRCPSDKHVVDCNARGGTKNS
jgi:hypothetical protein